MNDAQSNTAGAAHHHHTKASIIMSAIASRTAPAPARKGRRGKTGTAQRRQRLAAYTLIAPFMLLFVALTVVPLLYAGYLSFFRQQMVGGTAFVFLENYARALTDAEFLSGVGRMCLVLVTQVPIMIGLALLFALAIDSGLLYLKRFIRLSIFVPYAVPGVVAALMWGYLYGHDFGPFAQVADLLGLPAPDFLGTPGATLGSILNIVTWEFIGYNMIIMYSALRSIPTELYEAARVDGASEWRVAWSIKIPAIRPAILLTVIFSVIGSFQLFNEPNLLRGMAPSTINSSYTPNLYAYNLAFINQDVNYAAAIAFLLGVVIMIVSYVVQLSGQRKGAAL